MAELLFERGLFATLAAALVIPELTTFLIFAFVAIRLASLAAYQIWLLLQSPAGQKLVALHPAAPPDLRVVPIEQPRFPAE
jgi:hypothetical protein